MCITKSNQNRSERKVEQRPVTQKLKQNNETINKCTKVSENEAMWSYQL